MSISRFRWFGSGQSIEHRTQAATVATYLQDRRLLLVLDNFEHVLPAAADVACLLTACPRVSVLATSRAPLSVPGERELAVAPLAVPDLAAAATVSDLTAVASVTLFARRCEAATPSFRVTEANAATVARSVLGWTVCRWRSSWRLPG